MSPYASGIKFNTPWFWFGACTYYYDWCACIKLNIKRPAIIFCQPLNSMRMAWSQVGLALKPWLQWQMNKWSGCFLTHIYSNLQGLKYTLTKEPLLQKVVLCLSTLIICWPISFCHNSCKRQEYTSIILLWCAVNKLLHSSGWAPAAVQAFLPA